MPLSFTVHATHIDLVAEGKYTYTEVVDAFEAMIDEASTRLPILVDARGSSENPPFDEMVQTAMFSLSIAEDIGPRIALVVQGPLRYGLARMLAALAGADGRLVLQAFSGSGPIPSLDRSGHRRGRTRRGWARRGRSLAAGLLVGC